MEIEVAVPAHPKEFNFDSSNSSPYITAPSSPTRFGNSFFFSAPTSPCRSDSSSFRESNANSDWEDHQKTSSASAEFSRNRTQSDFGDDFEFNFSGQLEKGSFSAADELFQGGKIRPLEPPLGFEQYSAVSSPRSSSRSRALKKDGFDPFQNSIEETRKNEEFDLKYRGRERSQASFSGYVHKGSRSLSPLRVSDIMLEDQDDENSQTAEFVASTTSNKKPSSASSIFSAFSFPARAYKKWKLKDLLLFRSASEGRATEAKEALKRYDVLSKKESEEGKNSSFRSGESSGSGGSSSLVAGSRRRGPPVSAHELHYTANRAVSEELKRKTFLPYKPGWLGCLGFNPGVHDLSRVGSLTRGGS